MNFGMNILCKIWKTKHRPIINSKNPFLAQITKTSFAWFSQYSIKKNSRWIFLTLAYYNMLWKYKTLKMCLYNSCFDLITFLIVKIVKLRQPSQGALRTINL